MHCKMDASVQAQRNDSRRADGRLSAEVVATKVRSGSASSICCHVKTRSQDGTRIPTRGRKPRGHACPGRCGTISARARPAPAGILFVVYRLDALMLCRL